MGFWALQGAVLVSSANSITCRVLQCSFRPLRCWVSSPLSELVDCMKVHAFHCCDINHVAGGTQCMLLYRFSHVSLAEFLDGLARCNALVVSPSLPSGTLSHAINIGCSRWTPIPFPVELRADQGEGGFVVKQIKFPAAAFLTQVLMPCLAYHHRRQRWPPACL